jgi:PAS domain-containing protein
MIRLQSNDLYKQHFIVSLTTTLKFVVFGVLWILVSDYVLFLFHLPSTQNFPILHIEVLKGVGFVVVMGIIFFIVLQRETRSSRELSSQEIFKQNPTPMWLYDLQTLRFLDVNEAALKAYGYTREEFLLLSFSEICLKEDGRKDEGSRHFQLPGKNRIQCKDGSFAKANLLCFQTFFKKEAAGLVLGQPFIEPAEEKKFIDNDFVQQINDRISELILSKKELEVRNREINATNDELINLSNLLQNANKKMVMQTTTALQQKNNELNRIIDQVNDVIWTLDLAGNEENFVNASALRFFAISKEKAIDCPNFWLNYLASDAERLFVNEQLKKLETTNQIKLSCNIINAANECKTLNLKITVSRDDSGSAMKLECIGTEGASKA